MAKPLNLLFIWTDEQRADSLACYGNRQTRTPNVNRIASAGTVFDRAYCCQPVCTPSRGCIMTGTWPFQHGARFNNDPLHREARTLAEMIDPAYRRAYYGKWHLGDEIIAQHGFEEWVSVEDNYRRYYSDPSYLERFSDYHHFLVEQGFPPDAQRSDLKIFSRNYAASLAAPYTKAHFLGQRAAQFIAGHDQSRPFFLSVNFLEPHMPFFGPYNNHYDPAALKVGPAFNVPPGESSSLRNRMLSEQYTTRGFGGVNLQSEAGWRRLRANYMGLVELVDDSVGMMLDALERAGLADNTIIVYTSDHGEMMGDHRLLAKGVMYEESVRIPLIIRDPRRPAARAAAPFSQIDLAPTMLELLSQDQPDHLAGVSRAGWLGGHLPARTDDVITMWDGSEYHPLDTPGYSNEQADTVAAQRWRNLITPDGWKLNLCATDRTELFNLAEDPYELTNRADERGQQGRIAEMRSRIEAWQQSVGDDAPLAT